MEFYLATILLWPLNFAPRGWAFCAGQLLPISQNAALFSLLGTTYGGNGTTTFGLPNFQGRVPVGVGSGPGITTRVLGEVGGTETVTLTVSQMPAHAHALSILVSNAQAAESVPVPPINTLAAPYDAANFNAIAGYVNGTPTVPLNIGGNGLTGEMGGSTPTPIMQPYLAVNYIIALEGIFPSRN